MMIFIGIILITIFGYLLTLLLSERMHILERIGLSYLLGLGIFTFIVFCYSITGIKITFLSVNIFLIGLIFVELFLTKLFHRKLSLKLISHINNLKRLTTLEKILILLITIFIVTSFALTFYYPVNVWDALALYDFRAKIIAKEGYFLQIASNFSYFSQYPLFTSLSHTLVYVWGGNNPQFIYSLIYVSFLMCFYGSLREFSNRKIALVCTLLMASVPVFFEHSTFSYTNLPYSIYIFLGTVYLFRWIVEDKNIGYVILSGLLTGLSTWSRSTEPFWAVNILIILFYSFYKRKKFLFSWIWYFLPFFTIKEIWSRIYHLLERGIKSNSSFVAAEVGSWKDSIFNTVLDGKQILNVLFFIYQKIILTWFPVLIVFLFTVLLNLIKIRKRISSLFLVFILLYLGFLVYGTYVYSLSVPYWLTIPDSARRMAMFFIPLIIFYIGLSIDEFTGNI